MKRTLIILIFTGLSVLSFSQDLTKNFKFYFYPTIDIGFFSPGDVNEYIADDLDSYDLNLGTSDMIANFTIGAGVGMRIIKFIEIQWQGEYTFAPKLIVVTNGDNFSYTFSKYAAGMIANFHIPVNPSFKHSIFIGGGMFYNNLKFEDYSGSAFAPRIQAGFSINNFKFNPQVLLAVDLPKTSKEIPNSDPISSTFETFELNYTSFRIGVNLIF